MLFNRGVLEQIRAGRVTLAFRRSKGPTVKAGGSRITAIGRLAIDTVETVDPSAIPVSDARAAGFATVEALLASLRPGDEPVYRVSLRPEGVDPRIALRADDALSEADVSALAKRLAKMDGAAPWTRTALRLIAEHPGRRAGDLAPMAGLELMDFKTRVRRLKALGLTESLEVGYRLSPRGRALMEALRDS